MAGTRGVAVLLLLLYCTFARIFHWSIISDTVDVIFLVCRCVEEKGSSTLIHMNTDASLLRKPSQNTPKPISSETGFKQNWLSDAQNYDHMRPVGSSVDLLFSQHSI